MSKLKLPTYSINSDQKLTLEPGDTATTPNSRREFTRLRILGQEMLALPSHSSQLNK